MSWSRCWVKQISKIAQLAKVFSAVGVPLCHVVDSPINPADEYDNWVVDSVSLSTTFLSIVFSHDALQKCSVPFTNVCSPLNITSSIEMLFCGLLAVREWCSHTQQSEKWTKIVSRGIFSRKKISENAAHFYLELYTHLLIPPPPSHLTP